MEELAGRGADVNAADNSGNTAVIFAAVYGHTEVVEALAGGNADVNAADDNGNTAVILAAGEGHTEVVEALAERGADVKVFDKVGFNAVMTAAGKGHTEVVEALVGRVQHVNRRLTCWTKGRKNSNRKHVIEKARYRHKGKSRYALCPLLLVSATQLANKTRPQKKKSRAGA